MNSVKFQNTTLMYRILLHFYTLIRIQFIIKSKRIKYLEVNLTKELKEVHSERHYEGNWRLKLNGMIAYIYYSKDLRVSILR